MFRSRLTAVMAVLTVLVMINGAVFAQSGASGRGRSRGLASYNVTIQANAPNATVMVDGASLGGVPQTVEIEAGTHSFMVRAPGFFDWSQSVEINENRTITASLQPIPGEITLTIPSSIQDGTRANPSSEFRVFVDGREMSGRTFQVAPGRRTIRVTTGGLAAETVINVSPATSYIVTPSFGVSVR
ncbi:MAG: PEGA domain-containing protein [Alkalispirochaeta sp.]